MLPECFRCWTVLRYLESPGIAYSSGDFPLAVVTALAANPISAVCGFSTAEAVDT